MKKILTQLRFDFSLDPTKTFSVMTKVLIYKSHGELSISVILTHKSTFQSTNLQFSHAYANQLFFANAKGQLISKQNCRAITSPKKQTQDFCPGSLLLQGQYKRESIFLQKEDRLSFCINLEVVIFQDSEVGLFFGRSFETIICFRNLLTFSYSILIVLLSFGCNQELYLYVSRSSRIQISLKADNVLFEPSLLRLNQFKIALAGPLKLVPLKLKHPIEHICYT